MVDLLAVEKKCVESVQAAFNMTPKAERREGDEMLIVEITKGGVYGFLEVGEEIFGTAINNVTGKSKCLSFGQEDVGQQLRNLFTVVG